MHPHRLIVLTVTLAAGCARDRSPNDLARGGLPSPLARDLSRQTPVPTPQPPPPPTLAAESNPPPRPPSPDVVDSTPPARHAVSVISAPQHAAEPKQSPVGSDLASVKIISDAAKKRVAELEDFECRLVKREVVGGKSVGPDELLYRFRAKPMSVYMKVLSDTGKGREVLYVQGENGNKMTVVTGQGDNALVGVGYKTLLDPDSRLATAKTRYKASEAGFGRTVKSLDHALASGTPGAVKALGLVARPELRYALEGVEVAIAPGVEPLLPSGGVRRIYFDPRPDAPAYMLPVLVETADATGREVEYYFFDQVKMPANLPAETWNPARMGKS